MKIRINQPHFFNETGDRENNEDTIYPDPGLASKNDALFMVCDGMGGHEKGEVASRIASREIARFWRENPDMPDSEDKIFRALTETIQKLNKAANPGEPRQMGTTLALASIGADRLFIAHVGDSRVYLIRPGSGVIFCTEDHSHVQALIRAGLLAKENARTHPKKNIITRCIQPFPEEKINADTRILTDIQAGDYLLLCSDGVTETLTDEQLVEILSNESSDAEKMERMKNLCRNNSEDNFSAYLLSFVAG